MMYSMGRLVSVLDGAKRTLLSLLFTCTIWNRWRQGLVSWEEGCRRKYVTHVTTLMDVLLSSWILPVWETRRARTGHYRRGQFCVIELSPEM
jgi:hypothetical protein